MNPTAGLEAREVHAWGRTRATRSQVLRAGGVDQIRALLDHARAEGLSICARGAGLSFGDQILNDGQVMLDASGMDRILGWDGGTGRLLCEGGATMARILEFVLARNWTLDACVGAPEVTVGGAVSSNVHGKNSWKRGNFAAQLRWMKVLLASGEIVTVDPIRTPELLRGIAGGLGLLGVILEAELQCRPVPGPFVDLRLERARSLREIVDRLEAARADSEFLVAWIDAFAEGRALGRGFSASARWTEGPSGAATRLGGAAPTIRRLLRPFHGPRFVRWTNRLAYHLHPDAAGRGRTVAFRDFNFMQGRLPGFDPRGDHGGALEFQPLVPRERGVETLEEILRLCQRSGMQSELCGLKLHRPDDCLLSYALDDYSLGIAVHRRGRSAQELQSFSRDLYSLVADRGGLAYACKDECVPRDIFARMYPGLAAFKDLKRRMDPEGLFSSDLYRRLIA